MPYYQIRKSLSRETDGSAIITPEEEGYAPFRVDCDYVHKHKPQMGGYYVKYKDGYESFSPADAFEDGYESVGKPKSAEDKNLYNPTCAVTGERSNLNMFPIRNENDEMIGWIFLNENLNRSAYDFSLNRELK